MRLSPKYRVSPLLALLVASACSAGPAPGPSSPAPSVEGGAAPVVRPGAPGEASRSVDPERIPGMTDLGYHPADVRFMQGMIPHHAQALQMTALVPERTADEGFRRMALRMEISQTDEIVLMSRWLEAREEAVPPSAAMAHGMHAAHGAIEMPRMPGMLSADQMARLEAARGATFERLFLQYMIMHHQGALTMVDRLFSTSGAGQDTDLFRFASDVDADQGIEIRRMRQMLEARGGPLPDPPDA